MRYFNINLNNFYNKKNATKFILLGSFFIILGIFSMLFKNIGIKLLSWAIAFIMIYLSYINLKSLNELKRYASKEMIYPYQRKQAFFLLSAILLIIFPEKIHSILSSITGFAIVFYQLSNLFKNRKNHHYKLGFFNTLVLILGFFLIASPLFLSKFIATIISILLTFAGVILITIGKKLKY